MTSIDRISAVVILLFGVVASMESIRTGIWDGGMPGSGFFPLLGAGGITLLAALLLLTNRSASRDPKEPFLPRGGGLRKFGTLALALLLYPLLVQLLGFALGSALFLASLFRYPGGYSWKTSLGLALLTIAALYLGLVVLLKAQLPTGLLGI